MLAEPNGTQNSPAAAPPGWPAPRSIVLQNPIRPALIAGVLALSALAPAAALADVANSTIVSRANGADGLPFPATLVTASPDGRFVVVAAKDAPVSTSGYVAPTTPEAAVASGTVYLRDRTAGSTAALTLQQGLAGPG